MIMEYELYFSVQNFVILPSVLGERITEPVKICRVYRCGFEKILSEKSLLTQKKIHCHIYKIYGCMVHTIILSYFFELVHPNLIKIPFHRAL